MPLMKSADADRSANSAIVLDLGDLAAQAQRLRDRAEAKARQIVEQAQREADELTAGAEARGHEQGLKEGYDKGYAAGLEAGQTDALKQWQKKLAAVEAQWTDAATQWQGRFDELDRDARQAVLRFALALAAKVVHRQIELDPSVVVDQVEASLKHVLGASRVKICVHPDDRPLVDAALPNLERTLAQFDRVELVEDSHVTPGGCVLRYGQGMLDATVETQLQRIAAQMLAGDDSADTVAGDADTADEASE
ncbi:MAG: FliH/SctL family protein [Phycisphaeraceae bacterium]